MTKPLYSITAFLLVLFFCNLSTSLLAQNTGTMTVLKATQPEIDTTFRFSISGPSFDSLIPENVLTFHLYEAIPNGITESRNEELVISDDKHRINLFDKNGNFIKAWGWGVSTGASSFEICTSGCLDGLSGSGDGQMNNPGSVAVDSSGNIFVLDVDNSRIQKFDSSGNFLSKWGSAGSAESQFNGAEDIAIDQDNNLYVSESGNFRVQKFDTSGNFIEMWGWGVDDGTSVFQNCNSGCQSGISGNGNGQFVSAKAIAIKSDGTIVVSDINDGRIQSFDSDGNYVSQISISHSHDIAFDSEGNILGARTFGPGGDRVHKYDESGTQLFQFTMVPPQYNSFYIDKKDNLFVNAYDGVYGGLMKKFVPKTFQLKDPSSNSVQFTGLKEGTYYITELPNPDWTLDSIVDSEGNTIIGNNCIEIEVLASDNDSCTFYNFLPVAQLNVTLVATPEDGNPFDFCLEGRSADLGILSPIDTFGSQGTGEMQFIDPIGIAIDSNDHVYVMDNGNERIQKFDLDGNFIEMWGWGVATGANQFEICTENCLEGITGGGAGQFDNPFYAAVDSNNGIWITDSRNDRIQHFDANGNFLKTIGWGVATGANQFEICTSNCQTGIRGTGPGQMEAPSGISIDQDGRINVLELDGDNRLLRFDLDGSFHSSFETIAFEPYGLEIDDNGFIYITDLDYNTIMKYTHDGSLLFIKGYEDDLDIFQPWGLASDKLGHLYVTSSEGYSIVKINDEGDFLSRSGIPGSDFGQFDYPTDVVFDNKGNLWVVDNENERIAIWRDQDYLFTLNDPANTEQSYSHLIAGDYNLYQTCIPPGWTLNSLVCDAGNPQVMNDSVMITANAGDTINCTFNMTFQPCTVNDYVIAADSIGNGTVHAIQSISAFGAVQTGADMTFKAGDSITLISNFEVIQGGIFNAIIEDCLPSLKEDINQKK